MRRLALHNAASHTPSSLSEAVAKVLAAFFSEDLLLILLLDLELARLGLTLRARAPHCSLAVVYAHVFLFVLKFRVLLSPTKGAKNRADLPRARVVFV